MRGRHHTDWANLSKRLAEEDPAAFIREAENVEALRTHPAWGFLEALVEARVQQLSDRMLAGSEPLSQAQYARHAGEIVGLQSVLGIPDTVLDKAERAREALDDAAELAVIGGG